MTRDFSPLIKRVLAGVGELRFKKSKNWIKIEEWLDRLRSKSVVSLGWVLWVLLCCSTHNYEKRVIFK